MNDPQEPQQKHSGWNLCSPATMTGPVITCGEIDEIFKQMDISCRYWPGCTVGMLLHSEPNSRLCKTGGRPSRSTNWRGRRRRRSTCNSGLRLREDRTTNYLKQSICHSWPKAEINSSSSRRLRQPEHTFEIREASGSGNQNFNKLIIDLYPLLLLFLTALKRACNHKHAKNRKNNKIYDIVYNNGSSLLIFALLPELFPTKKQQGSE